MQACLKIQIKSITQILLSLKQWIWIISPKQYLESVNKPVTPRSKKKNNNRGFAWGGVGSMLPRRVFRFCSTTRCITTHPPGHPLAPAVFFHLGTSLMDCGAILFSYSFILFFSRGDVYLQPPAGATLFTLLDLFTPRSRVMLALLECILDYVTSFFF